MEGGARREVRVDGGEIGREPALSLTFPMDDNGQNANYSGKWRTFFDLTRCSFGSSIVGNSANSVYFLRLMHASLV